MNKELIDRIKPKLTESKSKETKHLPRFTDLIKDTEKKDIDSPKNDYVNRVRRRFKTLKSLSELI
jgi:lipid II:glycine glycyltransferase (peptidoglycan interpeptide bridge formation enzyme)